MAATIARSPRKRAVNNYDKTVKIEESAIHNLSMKDIEKFLSLISYHKAAVLLGLNCDEFWNYMRDQKTKKEKQAVFNEVVQPYLGVWISCVYVVHECFLKLSIEDKKLHSIISDKDLKTLEIFRHNTFYYNPHYKSNQHNDFYNDKLTSVIASLHQRHGVLIRRFAKLVQTHLNVDENVLF